MQQFEATIKTSEDSSGAWVDIPAKVASALGAKGQVKVKATFDGYSYRGSIANMGTGSHILIVRKDVRKAIGKSPGDQVMVRIEKDTDERKVELPPELVSLLKDKKLNAFYQSLSYTNRKEYAHWISSAKRDETRQKRLVETKRRLSEGIKNPFVK